MRRIAIGLAALALAGCGAKSTGATTTTTAKQVEKPTTTKKAATTTTQGTDPHVALVVERYGDCITRAGADIKSGAGEKNVVVFTGPGVLLTFSIVERNGKTFTPPADESTTNALAAAGADCG